MISFKPLQHTMIDKGVKKMELVRMVGMSNATLSKINKNQYIALEVIERICLALDCPIEAVVKIEKDPDA